MLKSQALKFSSMLVQRTWIRGVEISNESQLSRYTDVIDIWDSGNLRYERVSNGEDYSWEVVKREFNDTGFTEVLKEFPLYKCPLNLVWQESYPLVLNNQGFEIPGWSVIQKIISIPESKPKVLNMTFSSENNKQSRNQVPGRGGNLHRGGRGGRGGRGRIYRDR